MLIKLYWAIIFKLHCMLIFQGILVAGIKMKGLKDFISKEFLSEAFLNNYYHYTATCENDYN